MGFSLGFKGSECFLFRVSPQVGDVGSGFRGLGVRGLGVLGFRGLGFRGLGV